MSSNDYMMSSNDLPKQCYYPNHCIQSYVENIKGLCHLVCNQVDKPNHSMTGAWPSPTNTKTL